MAHEVQRLVLLDVVCLLKDGDVVGAALVQVTVVGDVHRIDLEADVAEVLARELAGFADVGDAALLLALARQHENLLHAALGDDLHLVLDLLLAELQPVDVVVAVEAAVDAVILAVVGDVERREEVDRVAEVAARLAARALGHLLEKRQGGRREQRLEVLDGAGLVLERALDIEDGVGTRVVIVHGRDDRLAHGRVDLLHVGPVGHRVRAARGVHLKPVLLGERRLAELIRVDKEIIFLIRHHNALPFSFSATTSCSVMKEARQRVGSGGTAPQDAAEA